MELVLVVLAMIVIIVAIDAFSRRESGGIGGRFDERRAETRSEPALERTDKIVVDMTDRDRD
jgi:hypothetical protein